MKHIITVLVVLFLFTSAVQAQFWKRDLNQLDSLRRKTGKWITYQDSTQKVKSFKGYFIEGREAKKSILYHPNGKRMVIFKYKRNSDALKCKYYYYNGKIQSRAHGFMTYSEDEIRFFLDGKSRDYNEKGKLVRIAYYKDGFLEEEQWKNGYSE